MSLQYISDVNLIIKYLNLEQVVLYVKHHLYGLQYGIENFFQLPNDMSSGSRY